MKIPKRVTVAGHEVAVWLEKDLSHGGVPVYGWSSSCTGEICLARRYRGVKLAEAHIVSTFLHELLHQIDDRYGIGLSEKKIAMLERGLFQVIRDNKLDFSQ
jgi:hypothetical protein